MDDLIIGAIEHDGDFRFRVIIEDPELWDDVIPVSIFPVGKDVSGDGCAFTLTDEQARALHQELGTAIHALSIKEKSDR